MKRHAFSLVEAVAAVAIIGLTLTIAGPLVASLIRGMGHTQRAATDLSRVDRTAALLRDDAWNAIHLAAANDRTLVCRQTNQRSVVWQIARTGRSMRRTVWRGEAQLEQRTWPMPRGLSFAVDAYAIELRKAGDERQPGTTMRFVSQIMLLPGGGGP